MHQAGVGQKIKNHDLPPSDDLWTEITFWMPFLYKSDPALPMRSINGNGSPLLPNTCCAVSIHIIISSFPIKYIELALYCHLLFYCSSMIYSSV